MKKKSFLSASSLIFESKNPELVSEYFFLRKKIIFANFKGILIVNCDLLRNQNKKICYDEKKLLHRLKLAQTFSTSSRNVVLIIFFHPSTISLN